MTFQMFFLTYWSRWIFESLGEGGSCVIVANLLFLLINDKILLVFIILDLRSERQQIY